MRGGGGGGGGGGGRLNQLIHGDLFGKPSQYFPKYDLVKKISQNFLERVLVETSTSCIWLFVMLTP